LTSCINESRCQSQDYIEQTLNEQKWNIIEHAIWCHCIFWSIRNFYFGFSVSFNAKHSSWLWSTSISLILKVLKRSALTVQKEAFFIQNINVISFQALIRQLKKNYTEIFAMFVKDIDRKIVYNTQCNLNIINVSFINKLIVELSFKLIFWIRLDSKSSCSHFQLDSSWVEHIFNLTQLDSTRNQVNSTWLVKNSSLTFRELNIEIFPIFDFCIIFLHYLLIESHEGKHEDHLIESHKEKHEDRLIESHKEKHEDHLIESHDEKTWRSFDRRSLQET